MRVALGKRHRPRRLGDFKPNPFANRALLSPKAHQSAPNSRKNHFCTGANSSHYAYREPLHFAGRSGRCQRGTCRTDRPRRGMALSCFLSVAFGFEATGELGELEARNGARPSNCSLSDLLFPFFSALSRVGLGFDLPPGRIGSEHLLSRPTHRRVNADDEALLGEHGFFRTSTTRPPSCSSDLKCTTAPKSNGFRQQAALN